MLAAALAVGIPLHELRAAQSLALHPDNPRYFLWRGQPTVLITSGEHYGAVLNLDFDYGKYLDTLARDKLNLTRTFAGGAYVEPQGSFGIARNTLAPAAGRFLCPFARSGEPGYAGGGNKFDLNRWDEACFKRFRDFVAQAGRRGVVVEVNLFCPMYEEAQWKLSPFSTNNNVNGLGRIPRTSVYTLDKHGGLLEAQERMTRKFVDELKDFDNVYYEICNEAYFGGVTLAWQHHIADVIHETEAKFPARQRHLISQNIANNTAKVEKPHPAVSIFNFHYATPPDAVAMNWNLSKVIGDNETGFRGTNDAPYRMEGWDFILAGGALYNNLDYSFVAGQEDGTFVYPASQPGGGNPDFRRQMRVLREFINDFNFIRMKPDNAVIKGGVPVTLTARALVEPAKAYAVYLRPAVVTQFSVRWTGQIEAPESGDYTFHTFSNDGVRLWVNGRKLIDNWTDHGETEDTGRIELEAGKRADVKLEYFYNGGQSVMKLWWSRAGGKKEPLPPGALWLPDGSAHGLRGEYFQGTNFDAPGPVRADAQVNFAWGTKSPFKEAKAAPLRALEMDLPAGNYRAEWIDPPTGRQLKQERFKHAGGVKTIDAPAFSEDAALRVRRN
ncbi:MAG TPA: PA14 domain-containing protein [Verrucomicrobiae bacterium]|nr:PA14 domain-containing protein [Verrucomicrobiae bacterium]